MCARLCTHTHTHTPSVLKAMKIFRLKAKIGLFWECAACFESVKTQQILLFWCSIKKHWIVSLINTCHHSLMCVSLGTRDWFSHPVTLSWYGCPALDIWDLSFGSVWSSSTEYWCSRKQHAHVFRQVSNMHMYLCLSKWVMCTRICV